MSDTDFLLINPWIIDFKAFDLWMKPLGLLYIGSILKENGFKVKLIDCMDRLDPNIHGLTTDKSYGCGRYYYEELEKPEIYKNIPRRYKRYGIPPSLLKRYLRDAGKPKAVLVTSYMTYWYPGVRETIKTVKEIYKDIPVILGGIYAILCSEHAHLFSGADYVVSDSDKKNLRHIIQEITGAKSLYLPESYHKFPSPLYSLYNKLSCIAVTTSFGCPYNCTYCASTYLNREFIQLSPLKIAEEIIATVRQFNIKDVAFYDDALFVNYEKHLKVILQEVEDSKLSLRFHTPNGIHARYVDKEVAKDLRRFGFTTIRFGLETARKHRQKETGNKVTNEELEKAVKSMVQAGYSSKDIGVYMMLGMPGQDYGEILETVNFLASLKVRIFPTQFSPIPHTQDWELIKNIYGYNEDVDPLLHNNTYYLFNSKEISWTEIQDIQRFINRHNAKCS